MIHIPSIDMYYEQADERYHQALLNYMRVSRTFPSGSLARHVAKRNYHYHRRRVLDLEALNIALGRGETMV